MLLSSIIAGTQINHWQRNTMIVEAQVIINGSKAAIWAAITNIENASEIISGVARDPNAIRQASDRGKVDY